MYEIRKYISDGLLEPVTATNQVTRIMDAIDSLNNMPMRQRLYDREPWRSHGLRIVSIDNYVVLYLPDKIEQTVTIIRIMYGGRDIDSQLSTNDIE